MKTRSNHRKLKAIPPMANLCSYSNIFEKLILKRIIEIHKKKVGHHKIQSRWIPEEEKHIYTKSELQSMISRYEYVMVSNLDINVVNISLLIKRLRILGLPEDLMKF
jgi:hypothetical protein